MTMSMAWGWEWGKAEERQHVRKDTAPGSGQDCSCLVFSRIFLLALFTWLGSGVGMGISQNDRSCRMDACPEAQSAASERWRAASPRKFWPAFWRSGSPPLQTSDLPCNLDPLFVPLKSMAKLPLTSTETRFAPLWGDYICIQCPAT